jgi:hypothetical protein
MIKMQKVTSNVKMFPASLHTFIDTPNCVLEDRVQYSTVHILNVFCDGHRQVHRDFLITLYIYNCKQCYVTLILTIQFLKSNYI